MTPQQTTPATMVAPGQWRLFSGPEAEVSTAGFHACRERAAHLEDPAHQPRLQAAAALVVVAATMAADRDPAVTGREATVSDLGCGDGGLLSLLVTPPAVRDTAGAATGRAWMEPIGDAWGYDFVPANQEGWAERDVPATQADVFGKDADQIRVGDIAVVTEVLEHLTAPHAAAAWIATRGARWLVASSPLDEHPGNTDPVHAWAFTPTGYARMLTGAGWRLIHHAPVGRYQLVLATTLPPGPGAVAGG
jgi:hypothetical protein